MWVYVSLHGFRCKEREEGEERKTRRCSTLSEREKSERVDHTGHKETPTTRASPFIVHNTSLFTLRSKSVHDVYSNQLIATEALDKGFAKQKDSRRLVSDPVLQIQRGEGKRKEAGYIH